MYPTGTVRLRQLRTLTYVAGVLILILAACSRDSSPNLPPTNPEELRIESFMFEAENNAQEIRSDAVGEITGNTIRVLLSAETDAANLVASFSTETGELYVGAMEQESGATPNDFTYPVEYVLRSHDGFEEVYTVEVTVLGELRNVVPHLYIETDGGAPIDSKKERVGGTLEIDGMGEYEDFNGIMEIRGRGNSTWAQPKKPYQIKLDSKESLLGLPKGKKWILLANYLDRSLMGNAIALKAGRLLQMPFTHNIIPVDVTVNGEFVGSYMLTEHKEVKKNRIDLESLGSDGVYFEFDTHDKDKHYEFTSETYDIPVIVKYPKLKKVKEQESDPEVVYGPIVQDFQEWEALLEDPAFPDNGYRDRFDVQSLARYLLVFYLSANREINWPKSVYMYHVNDTYHMGPLWDFDWAWGYTTSDKMHYIQPDRSLWLSNTERYKGIEFFGRLMEDPVFVEHFETEWNDFKNRLYPQLVSYMEGYVVLIEDSYHRDFQKWEQGAEYIDDDAERMFSWLDARVAYIDSVVEELLD